MGEFRKIFDGTTAYIRCLRIIERRKVVRDINDLELRVDTQQPAFDSADQVVLMANVRCERY